MVEGKFSPRRIAIQSCAEDAGHTVGLVLDTTGDLAGVQDLVKG
jgi:hypothetical protein